MRSSSLIGASNGNVDGIETTLSSDDIGETGNELENNCLAWCDDDWRARDRCNGCFLRRWRSSSSNTLRVGWCARWENTWPWVQTLDGAGARTLPGTYGPAPLRRNSRSVRTKFQSKIIIEMQTTSKKSD